MSSHLLVSLFSRLAAAIMVMSICGTSVAAPHRSDPLFLEALPGSSFRGSDDLPPGIAAFRGAIRSSSEVLLNLEQLRSSPTSARVNAGHRGLVGQDLQVVLSPGERPRKLVVQTVHEPEPGTISLTGRIVGEEASAFAITTSGSDVLGRIHSESSLYVLTRLQGTHRLLDIEKTLVIQNPAHFGQHDISQPPKGIEERKSGAASGGNVRMFALYSPSVASRMGNINVLVNNIIAEFNSSLWNSGLSATYQVSLAALQVVNDEFSGKSHENVLNQMRSESGSMENLRGRTSVAEADIAMTIISANDMAICPDTSPTLDTCGPEQFKRIGGVAYPYSQPQSPYLVVTDSYALGDLTALHEIGHVLGGNHQGTNIPSPCPFGQQCSPPDATGHVASSTWMTVMATYGDSGCLFRTLNNVPTCIRNPYWSNGSTRGVPGVSNMVDAFATTFTTVANYYQSPVSAPGVPRSIAAPPSGLIVNVSWSSPTPGAGGIVENCVLEWAGAGSPKPQYQVVYNGYQRQAAQQIKYCQANEWRIRACNSAGCSPALSTGSVTYPSSGC